MTTNKLFVAPIFVDGLHLDQGKAAHEPVADFTRLPYLQKFRDGLHAGHSYEINGENPYISSSVNAEPFSDTNFWLRPGVHLHWALPDGLTIGTHPENATGDRQLTFPAAPNRWIVQRRYQGIGQRAWLIESDFLYAPAYWLDDDQTKADLKRHLVAYPVPVAEMGEPPFRYMGRQTELKAGVAATAPGDYLAPYLDGLQKRGIDISDYPSQLTAIGYGEPTFAAFYPNSQSVFGLHDPDFGGVDPPDGLWYEVYGCYETLGDDPLADDPIHQLAGDIPAAVDANNFLTWFDKTQHLITRLEEFYGWSAPFAWSQDEVDLVNRLLADILQPRLGETTIDVHLPSEPKRDLHGRQALVDYLTDSKEGWLTPRQLKQAFDTKKVVQPSRTVSLEKLIQSCALQRPQRLICYGQVWRDSFVRSGVSAHSNQIFVGSTGTEAVAAYSASELALDRYPRTPDPSDDEHAYASYIQVQRNEKARLERFIEAIHLTPMLDKQRVDIGARLEEERHTKSFTAHPGSMLWLVTLASQIAAEDHAPSDNEEPPVELSLPPDLAHELNELNALQSAYDQAQHAVTALRQQIYCDWYRYMLLAYPSDDDALDYEAVRLAPDIDGLIAYIRGKDVRPLEEAVQHAGRVDELDDHSAATRYYRIGRRPDPQEERSRRRQRNR